MLKGLQLGELAALGPSGPRDSHRSSLGEALGCLHHRPLVVHSAAGFPGTPALRHSFFSHLSLPPALPFTSSRDRLSTQGLSVPENMTYLSPTSRWPRQVLLSVPWPEPRSTQEVKDSRALAHSQGKSRELNSFSPVPTSLEGTVCRESCPG